MVREHDIVPEVAESAHQEHWNLRDINSDLHVIHFGPDKNSEFPVGDKGASQTISEIVGFAYRNLPAESLIVAGNHSLGYDQLVDQHNYSDNDNKRSLEHQIAFLRDQRNAILAATEAQAKEHAREKYPTILFGVEADIYLDENGTPYLNPPKDALVAEGAAPDVVIASFHKYEQQIPDGIDKADKLYHGFIHVIESDVVHKLGHPMKELTMVRESDPSRFNEILQAAKAKGIVFEVNTGPRMIDQLDDPGIQETINALVASGNLIDMGSDFHNFSMFKRSGLIPPSSVEANVLSPKEEQLIADWTPTREKEFYERFRALESKFWKALEGIDMSQTILIGEENMPLNQVWKLYKGELSTDDASYQELQDLFASAMTTDEIQRLTITAQLDELYHVFRDKPAGWHTVEPLFAKIGLTLGDLKRMVGPARRLRREFNLPRSQFINVWPVEQQIEHFNSLKDRSSTAQEV